VNTQAHLLSAAYGLHDPFAPGRLEPGVHDPLVAEIERIATEAGISPGDITGRDYHLTEFETQYLLGFRRTHKTGKLGLIYIGSHDPGVTDRMRSVCGALLRNFITARLIVREELVTELFDKRRQPSADLVAVPDMSYSEAPAATRRALASWLMGRVARGKQTAFGVPNAAALKDIFGAEAPLYKKHFAVLHGVNVPG